MPSINALWKSHAQNVWSHDFFSFLMQEYNRTEMKW
jgi:hypothetical protein